MTPTNEARPAETGETLRLAVKSILPIGNPQLPDDRVVPIYVRMSELRALHELVATPPPTSRSEYMQPMIAGYFANIADYRISVTIT